ncbi:hypothetical protein EAL2_c13390 [Peptoclostridium acidaminophilum DSM 3953]|uniref:Uncharacterized protein n=1 Tax=Peptoclostridium acidaminophilum DSM 3953 TaxID=1286171 RepID=W8T4H7_PEPAC|nr:hypothetical protein [Peptoclostridium acidaminophilum]AHM56634.1 hypothetical protein EAL2_c13390 [Peptoclostridium acidaminophilum DSM 3953]
MKNSLFILGILNYLTVALYTLITIIFNRNFAVTDFLTDTAMLLVCLNISAMLINKIRLEFSDSIENTKICGNEIDLTVNGDEELRDILKDPAGEDEELFDEIRLEDINNIK